MKKHLKKTTLYIKGMHCNSCDILVRSKLGEVKNITEVLADYKNEKAQVCYVGELNLAELNKKLNTFGYEVLPDSQRERVEPLSRKLIDAGSIAVILFILYYFARELNLLPSFAITSELSLTAAFFLGLIASTSTCMATSGALFLATVGKLQKKESSFMGNIVPAVSFNVGRVGAYTFFGFVSGILGKTLSSNFQLGTALSIFIAAVMLIIGLDMLKLFSVSTVLAPSFSKRLFEKLQARLISHPKRTALLLGAITYLLPCGFTQTVQVYALSLADPVQSALTMMVFALGTVPALLAVGFASSFTKSRFYPYFTRIMGVLIIMIGLSYVGNVLNLYGVRFSLLPSTANDSAVSNIVLENGVQVATMNANASGYYPTDFTVKKGVPVRWIVKGENVFGCQGLLVAPKIGVSKTLTTGENIIEFTPEEEGQIAFSCAMGMFNGTFNVVGT